MQRQPVARVSPLRHALSMPALRMTCHPIRHHASVMSQFPVAPGPLSLSTDNPLHLIISEIVSPAGFVSCCPFCCSFAATGLLLYVLRAR